jgi:hypothetical protein
LRPRRSNLNAGGFQGLWARTLRETVWEKGALDLYAQSAYIGLYG